MRDSNWRSERNSAKKASHKPWGLYIQLTATGAQTHELLRRLEHHVTPHETTDQREMVVGGQFELDEGRSGSHV